MKLIQWTFGKNDSIRQKVLHEAEITKLDGSGYNRQYVHVELGTVERDGAAHKDLSLELTMDEACALAKFLNEATNQ